MDTEILIHAPWDASTSEPYLHAHPDASLYHHEKWLDIIEKTYGQKGCRIVCREGNRVVGLLMMTIFRGLSLKKTLISMPFFDFGGVLADSPEVERRLVRAAMRLGGRIGAQAIELRQTRPVAGLEGGGPDIPHDVKSEKVRLVMELPASSDALMKSFKSKLRSQIKRPIKAGCRAEIGGVELLDDFYRVFACNMRDLGSPVHAKALMRNVLDAFPGRARLVVVYRGETPIACAMVIGFKDTMENPWASSLREYSAMSPNMLLYWAMLEYAAESGYRYFDFGRSTPGEGTFKFKMQWGAAAYPLHWYAIPLRDEAACANAGTPDKSRYSKTIEYWKKLPVPVTCVAGPMIRRLIAL